MKIKDIDFTLKVKNHKASKYLRVLLLDILEEFERKHPRIIPSLERTLKNGDGRSAREKAEQFVQLTKEVHMSAKQLLKAIDQYMCDELIIEEGKAVPFITPDGDQAWSMKDDEEVVIGGKKEELTNKKSPKKTTKKPATKKRATKKKKD